MNWTTPRPRANHALLLWTTLLLMLTASLAFGQHPATLGSRFFNVSISENHKPLLAEAYYYDTDGVLVIQGPSLAAVIARAYDLEIYQVVDGPEWIHTTHLYDIKATPPPAPFAVSSEKGMLLALLAERFKLTTQVAEREVTTIALVPDPTTDIAVSDAGPNVSLDMLADRLSYLMHKPVRNLAGKDLVFASAPGKLFSLNLPLMLRQIDEQLGLTVEPRTSTMEVLAVTGAQRPLVASRDTAD